MGIAAEVSPLMRELSAYMAAAPRRKLPPEVAERAKLHILDSFAAMLSGSRLPPGKSAISYVRTRPAPREAGVLGTRIVTSLEKAALANGMCGHADETDDVHTPTSAHPGSSVIPAMLAIAEQHRLPGAAMLRATVLGYELYTRILLVLTSNRLLRAGHLPAGKGAVFGAGAAAGALLNLNAQKMRYLLSYLAQQTGGLATVFRDSHHVEKAYVYAGMSAHNGVAAALMVASGFTGVEDVFSGERNFLSTYAPDDADHEVLVRDLGRRHEIMRVRVKRWPVGGPIQSPLHVLSELMRQHRFRANDVDTLAVRLTERDLWTVSNRTMVDISLPHLLAVMLLDGKVTFASAHDVSRAKDPAVTALRKRMQLIGDDSLVTSVRDWRCAMEITFRDGRKPVQQTAAAGTAFEIPLERTHVEEKALDLMAPVLGKKKSGLLISKLLNLETVADARTLRRLYAC